MFKEHQLSDGSVLVESNLIFLSRLLIIQKTFDRGFYLFFRGITMGTDSDPQGLWNGPLVLIRFGHYAFHIGWQGLAYYLRTKM